MRWLTEKTRPGVDMCAMVVRDDHHNRNQHHHPRGLPQLTSAPGYRQSKALNMCGRGCGWVASPGHWGYKEQTKARTHAHLPAKSLLHCGSDVTLGSAHCVKRVPTTCRARACGHRSMSSMKLGRKSTKIFSSATSAASMHAFEYALVYKRVYG